MEILRTALSRSRKSYASYPLAESHHGSQSRGSSLLSHKRGRLMVIAAAMVSLFGVFHFFAPKHLSTGAAHRQGWMPSSQSSLELPSGHDENDQIPDASPPPRSAKDQRLFVVVPATSSSPDLCKVLMSAVANGYPTPVIVSWGVDYREVSHWDGGPHMTKLPGILNYLETAMRENADPADRIDEDDIIFILDGYDVWFQLPPEILLKRFHKMNARANARLREQWHGEGPVPMTQTIIASSQKNCYPPPSMGSTLHCDILPESPVRTDLYGSHTDEDSLMLRDYHWIRPKYLNGGSYMGPAGDMRRMLRRALFKQEEAIGRGKKLRSDQGFTAELFGEQELWRRARRADPVPADEAAMVLERDYEYGLGLDYRQELSLPTVFEEDDGEMVKLNDQDSIDRLSKKLGINPVRLQGVPDEIRTAKNPLADVLPDAEWGSMPLYADLFSESIPATLHHNAHKNNLKQRRVTWWDRTWFFPHLRELLELRLRPAPLNPLAIVGVGGGGGGGGGKGRGGAGKAKGVTYWASESDRKTRKPRVFQGVSTQPLPTIEWDEACRQPKEEDEKKRPWYDEIFRDGKGPM